MHLGLIVFEFTDRMRKTLDRILTAVLIVVTIAMAIPLLWYGGRAFVADRFVTRGESMYPTFHTGQAVYVNKLLMGARIYTDFDFDTPELHCFRMPGIRKLRRGDIAIFNYPYGTDGKRLGFKINYVYCKRCIGTPGDTVEIADGFYVDAKDRRPIPTGIPLGNILKMRATPDSVLLKNRCLEAGAFAGEDWTIKDFGPITVPSKGLTIKLDSLNLKHYARAMEWEKNRGAYAGEDSMDPLHDDWGLPGGEYTFRENWYFFAGDNVSDSRDSRYLGFVPEDFVIGIVKVNDKRYDDR